MKKYFKYMLSILLLVLSVSPILALEDVKLSDLLNPDSEVKAAEIEDLDQKEQERLREFQRQLGFSLPEYTDNPSYTITFTDPSPEKSGVAVKIDNAAYTDISSPYSFSALGLGSHNVIFKFTDKDGAPQELEYDLVVLPRAPIIKTPVISDHKMIISGTGLANSEVLLFISSDVNTYTDLVLVDKDGNWMYALNPESGLKDGIYTIVGFTRRYGYSSAYSQSVTLEVGGDGNPILASNTTPDVSFSFKSITSISTFKDILLNNKDLIYLVCGVFVFAVILTTIFSNIFSNSRTEKHAKKIEEKINQNTKVKEKTLRELFSEDNSKDKDKKEKVITKEQFLKDFKDVDPDQKDGKEYTPKATKKDVKVSLTSKQE